MRLVFILDETSFYQPDFFARFLDRSEDDVIGVGIVKKVPVKSDLNHYMATHFYYLRPGEALRLARAKVVHRVLDRVKKPHKGDRFFSIEAVAKCYGLLHFDIYSSINEVNYIETIHGLSPDVIVSSNSLIFGRELLEIPSRCCINRHSSLLPSYGGLWPVFQAVRSGEEFVGASIHTMERKIDRGILLAQRQVRIQGYDTVGDLYEKCFAVSVDALLDALRRIARDDMEPLQNSYNLSYFSFPTADHWQQFRHRKRRFF